MIPTDGPGVPRQGWRFMSMADNQDRDTFVRWLDKEVDIGRRKGVETAIRTTLRFLRFARKDLWREPHFKWFSGGVGEIRSDFGNVEYRPLGCNGPAPDQFTILIGAYKKGKVWTPQDARKTAIRRRQELLESPDRAKYAINL
jgi:hypothetical protein